MPLTHKNDGTLISLEVPSKRLAKNALGDPATRRLDVWLPPSYDLDLTHQATGVRYPVLFCLAGFTGSGLSHTNWRGFDENLPERASRLIREGKMGDAILVFPDCFTSLGGNQYINSSAIGQYADYLTQELVPLVDQTFRSKAHRNHRGVFGKSSGGYGALVHGMRYPEVWGGVASHSGDAGFEAIMAGDWLKTLTFLQRFAPPRAPGTTDVRALGKLTGKGVDDGRVAAFLKHFAAARKKSGDEFHHLMLIAMAATYDPNPKVANGFHLPFDLLTGERIEARWANWLAHDPIHLVREPAHLVALKSLRLLYIDCGWRDQYNIHFGSRILSRELQKARVKHDYQEFDDTHSGVDYRMDVSLPLLVQALR